MSTGYAIGKRVRRGKCPVAPSVKPKDLLHGKTIPALSRASYHLSKVPRPIPSPSRKRQHLAALSAVLV